MASLHIPREKVSGRRISGRADSGTGRVEELAYRWHEPGEYQVYGGGVLVEELMAWSRPSVYTSVQHHQVQELLGVSSGSEPAGAGSDGWVCRAGRGGPRVRRWSEGCRASLP